MATIQKLSVQDEVLGGNPKYQIKDKNGNIIYDECTIEMITSILTQGTNLNKALFDKIDANFEIIKPLVVTGTFTTVATTTPLEIDVGFKPDLVILFNLYNTNHDITASTSADYRDIPVIYTQQYSSDTAGITETGFKTKITSKSGDTAFYIAVKFIGGE